MATEARMARSVRFTASITFEKMVEAPVTVKVATTAWALPAATRRLVLEAMKLRPNERWTSVVILVERDDPDA
jgi:hypothetical protein